VELPPGAYKVSESGPGRTVWNRFPQVSLPCGLRDNRPSSSRGVETEPDVLELHQRGMQSGCGDCSALRPGPRRDTIRWRWIPSVHRHIGWFAVGLAVLLAGATKVTGQVVGLNIAGVYPLSGRETASIGVQLRKAADLAVSVMNTPPNDQGPPVAVTHMDSGAMPATSASVPAFNAVQVRTKKGFVCPSKWW
jgi:hypothetical protein